MRGKFEHIGLAALCLLAATLGCGDSDDNGGTYPGWPQIPDLVDGWPKWSSADTTKIAYAHCSMTWEEYKRYGDVTVWVVDIATGEMEMITTGAPADWTPDGSSILFYRNGRLFLIDLSTKQERLVADERSLVLMADLSPCGDKVAYVLDDTGHRGIWIRNLTSGSSEWVYSGYGPDWHPDGSKLLCDSLIVISQQGERLYKFPYPTDFRYPGHARWSPDGQAIAFRAKSGIWLMDADGSNLRELVGGSTPSWSPDGKRVAYGGLSADGRYTAIWVVNADGDAARQVTLAEAYPDSW